MRRTDACICIAESLLGPPETIITLLIGYPPIQNQKCFFFKKKGTWIVCLKVGIVWKMKNTIGQRELKVHWYCNFYQVIRAGFIQKDFKWNLLKDVRDLAMSYWRKIHARKNGQCKDPRTRMCLAFMKNSKETIRLEEWRATFTQCVQRAQRGIRDNSSHRNLGPLQGSGHLLQEKLEEFWIQWPCSYLQLEGILAHVLRTDTEETRRSMQTITPAQWSQGKWNRL